MIYARSGMKGHNVQEWQRVMNKVYIRKYGLPLLIEDGIFGSKTLSATIGFQKVLGVTPDGIVGDGTWSAYKRKYPYAPISFINPTTMSKTDVQHFDETAMERGKIATETGVSPNQASSTYDPDLVETNKVTYKKNTNTIIQPPPINKGSGTPSPKPKMGLGLPLALASIVAYMKLG